ncbi:MAG: PhoU domain-containing protein [Gemmatimonadota bacterium]
MFKEFFDIFRKGDQLQQAFDRSHEMLREDREMFESAMRSLREQEDARLDLDIYAKDQLINAYQREVRRKVFTHLTIASGRDLHAGLALVSVVVDIERIGDYTKNIVELALNHPARLKCGRFEDTIRRIETTVKTMFGLLLEALPENDEAKAREVMSEHWWIARRSDEIVDALIQKDEPELPGREAVTTALYVRYLKRVSAHLMDIASSVANPFDRIGFRGEDPSA